MKTPLQTSYTFNPNIPFRKSTYKKDENTAPIFNTLCIQTFGYCNLSCGYCPSNKISLNNKLRKETEMPWEMFEKIVYDLKTIKYTGKVGLYLFSEPLLDTKLVDRVRFLKQECPKAIPNTYTNGSLLTKQKIIDLMEAGMNYMWINAYNEKDDLKVEAILEDLKKTHPQYFGEDVGLQNVKSTDQIIRFKRAFRDGKPTDSTGFWNNRGGILVGEKHPSLEEPKESECTQPFRQMFINIKGDMDFCCADWNSIYRFGNIMDNHILELWNNDDIQRARKALKNKRRDLLFMCDKCDCKGGSFKHMLRYTDTLPEESIEEGAQKLKEKYQESYDKNFEKVDTDVYGDKSFKFVKELRQKRKSCDSGASACSVSIPAPQKKSLAIKREQPSKKLAIKRK